MKLFKNYENGLLLMSPETEGGASGGGTTNNQGGADDNNAGGDELSKIKAEMEALKKHRDEVLTEKKRLSEELKAIKQSTTESELKKAQADNNFEKLYNITLEAKKEIQSKFEELNRTVEETKMKATKTHMWNTFKKELGSELHDPSVAEKLVQWDKFVPDEKGEFNPEGIKQAVSEFRQKHSYMLKTDGKQMPADAAKPGETKQKHLADFFKPIK